MSLSPGVINTNGLLHRFSTSDSFEQQPGHIPIASVFDMAPTSQPMKDMTTEERQSLVKVGTTIYKTYS